MNKFAIKSLLSGIISLVSVTTSLVTNAAVIDTDSDGLIEINSLDDFNDIRHNLTGSSFRGSVDGCPASGCFGWELTRDLDFDTNKNGVLDAGDWNAGQSWLPIPDLQNIIFEGNSHSIANLRVTTADVRAYTLPGGSSAGDHRYGLFAGLNQSTVKNLRLLKPVIAADGMTIPASNFIFIGSLAARLDNGSKIFNVMANNASVSLSRNANPEPLKPSRVGGLVGQFRATSVQRGLLDGLFFSGSIQIDDQLHSHVAGGIVGQIEFSSIVNSSTRGNLVGALVGGLAGFSIETHFSNSYSTASIVGNASAAAGGLIGQNYNSVLENNYSTGTVVGGNTRFGGLIGLETSETIQLASSFSSSIVNNNLAQLIGARRPTSVILNSDTYQIIDPAGTILSSAANSYTRSITNAELQCATNPVDPLCSNPQAVASWDPAVWNFGSTNELPVLSQNSNYPWVNVDRPNSGQGDYESINAIKENYPEYACDTPIDFQVKEKRSGYVFSAMTPEKFDFFNAKQGLQCTASAQADGRCNNYEVSYLCDTRAAGGSTYWTNWASNSNPVGGANDSELVSSNLCSGGTTSGIRARVINSSTEYYGAPQKPSKFTLGYGFGCKNSDNTGGCKDYEARMLCSIKTPLTNP